MGGVGLAACFNQDSFHAKLVGALPVQKAVQGVYEVSAHWDGKSVKWGMWW